MARLLVTYHFRNFRRFMRDKTHPFPVLMEIVATAGSWFLAVSPLPLLSPFSDATPADRMHILAPLVIGVGIWAFVTIVSMMILLIGLFWTKTIRFS